MLGRQLLLALSLLSSIVANAKAEAAARPLIRVAAFEHWLAPSEYAVSTSDTKLETGGGLGLSLWVDAFPWKYLNVGVHALYVRRNARESGASALTQLGVHAGPSFRVGGRVLLGISALLGYQILAFEDALAKPKGLGLGALGTVGVALFPEFWLEAQLGFVAQPVGGHEASEIHMPLTLLTGFGFSAVYSN